MSEPGVAGRRFLRGDALRFSARIALLAIFAAGIGVLSLAATAPATPSAGARAGASAGPPSAGAAKVASIQNTVETRHGTEAGWSPSVLNQPLIGRDRIRTGPASRAAILYSDLTLQRMDQRSEIEIQTPTADTGGILRVFSGVHYFSSRTPREFRRIETPTVGAYVKGTEFVVEVAADTTTKITMLEGQVEATNSFGTLTVGKGEQAYVEPGKAPVKRIVVRPRDAVAWALYYPAVLGGSDAERLKAMGGGAGEDLTRAAAMLAAGQVAEARPLIEKARAAQPKNPIALALASVIQVAANEKEDALRLAEEAAAADPSSPAAALALSFAAQAAFDIARARAMAEKAAELDPASPTALARAAELRLAEGDLRGAKGAADAAVARAPGAGRALAGLGFVELAQLHSAAAEAAFERAVAADSPLSLAHLGLGIARIRRGRVDEGREELQIATALDPDDALLRAYLAKAYYEEKRPVEAGKELATAKELDPRDPTPYLYDAIRKQNENRPVEALYDLRASIARNDNRAVYRSRLLLDQDRAVRGSDLARVYNDLGFEQLGVVTARRSADEDQANYSSHLLLAGNYRVLPDFAPAFLSEVLQARIYQPVSVNAARPDVVNESVSFNEYTALFDRPRARVFGGLTTGRTNTNLDELFVNRPRSQSERIELDDSRIGAGQIVGTFNSDRFAGAIGYSKLTDDGFRINSDQANANYRGFFEFSPTDRDTFQLNALHARRETGDIPIRRNVTIIGQERFTTEFDNIGLGYHRVLTPSADLVVSAIYSKTRQAFDNRTSPVDSTGFLEGPQLELQQVLRRRSATWIFGAGGFDGKERIVAPGLRLSADDTFANGYAYVKLRGLGPLEVTLAASAESVVSPTGLFTPRDANIGGAELEFSESRVSPKAGLSLYLGGGTTLRAAGFYRLNPAIGRIQTLEPTQVAGFNQFFNEPGGTNSLSYGAGLDQELGAHVSGGLSWLRRELKIPEALCASPNPFSGCSFQNAARLVTRESHDVLGTAYLNVALGTRVAAGVAYSYIRKKFDLTQVSQDGFFEAQRETGRVHPQVRVFLPFGLFAGAGATYYDQKVTKLVDLTTRTPFVEPSRFWVGDLTLGYKLPRRYGSLLLEARNVGDREFDAFERAVEDAVIPARTVTLTANFAF